MKELWIVVKDVGVLKHFIVLMNNLYCGRKAIVRKGCGKAEWFPIGKVVRQGCILSFYPFNLYTENITSKTELDSDERGVEIGEGNNKHLGCPDDTILLEESNYDLKSLSNERLTTLIPRMP